VVAARPLPVGTVLAADMLAFKKPGDGIPAAQYHSLIGRRLRTALAADTKIALDHLE
jgi:N,N'-diacetyllegionaminate synthase